MEICNECFLIHSRSTRAEQSKFSYKLYYWGFPEDLLRMWEIGPTDVLIKPLPAQNAEWQMPPRIVRGG
jgi:hypothetical protein